MDLEKVITQSLHPLDAPIPKKEGEEDEDGAFLLSRRQHNHSMTNVCHCVLHKHHHQKEDDEDIDNAKTTATKKETVEISAFLSSPNQQNSDEIFVALYCNGSFIGTINGENKDDDGEKNSIVKAKGEERKHPINDHFQTPTKKRKREKITALRLVPLNDDVAFTCCKEQQAGGENDQMVEFILILMLSVGNHPLVYHITLYFPRHVVNNSDDVTSASFTFVEQKRRKQNVYRGNYWTYQKLLPTLPANDASTTPTKNISAKQSLAANRNISQNGLNQKIVHLDAAASILAPPLSLDKPSEKQQQEIRKRILLIAASTIEMINSSSLSSSPSLKNQNLFLFCYNLPLHHCVSQENESATMKNEDMSEKDEKSFCSKVVHGITGRIKSLAFAANPTATLKRPPSFVNMKNMTVPSMLPSLVILTPNQVYVWDIHSSSISSSLLLKGGGNSGAGNGGRFLLPISTSMHFVGEDVQNAKGVSFSEEKEANSSGKPAEYSGTERNDELVDVIIEEEFAMICDDASEDIMSSFRRLSGNENLRKMKEVSLESISKCSGNSISGKSTNGLLSPPNVLPPLSSSMSDMVDDSKIVNETIRWLNEARKQKKISRKSKKADPLHESAYSSKGVAANITSVNQGDGDNDITSHHKDRSENKDGGSSIVDLRGKINANPSNSSGGMEEIISPLNALKNISLLKSSVDNIVPTIMSSSSATTPASTIENHTKKQVVSSTSKSLFIGHEEVDMKPKDPWIAQHGGDSREKSASSSPYILLFCVSTVVQQKYSQDHVSGTNDDNTASECNMECAQGFFQKQDTKSISLKHQSYFPRNMSVLDTISIAKIAVAELNEDGNGTICREKNNIERNQTNSGFAYAILCATSSSDLRILLLEQSPLPFSSKSEDLLSSSATSLQEIGAIKVNEVLTKINANLDGVMKNMGSIVKGAAILRSSLERLGSKNMSNLFDDIRYEQRTKQKKSVPTLQDPGIFEKGNCCRILLPLNIVVSFSPKDTVTDDSERSPLPMPTNFSLFKKYKVATVNISLILKQKNLLENSKREHEYMIHNGETKRTSISKCTGFEPLQVNQALNDSKRKSASVGSDDIVKETIDAEMVTYKKGTSLQSNGAIHLKLDTLLQAMSKLETTLVSKIDELEYRIEDQNMRLSRIEDFMRQNR